MKWVGLAAMAWWVAGCSAPLPEAESAEAQLYATRCGGCHRVYAPSLLTAEMWKYQVERMQGQMARRGISPLNDTEQSVVLAYLQKHAGK